MQPGDNFRIAANGDADFIPQLENSDTAQNTGGSAFDRNQNKERIVNRNVTGTAAAREVREAGHYVSETLAVWRFLQVELDTMPSAAAINPLSATMHNFVGTGTAMTEIWTVETVADASLNLDSTPTAANGRFENGTLTATQATMIWRG